MGHLVRRTARQLETAGIGDARLEADLIWMTALDIDKANLYASFGDTPTVEQAGRGGCAGDAAAQSGASCLSHGQA